jgi:hypothetical protein
VLALHEFEDIKEFLAEFQPIDFKSAKLNEIFRFSYNSSMTESLQYFKEAFDHDEASAKGIQ